MAALLASRAHSEGARLAGLPCKCKPRPQFNGGPKIPVPAMPAMDGLHRLLERDLQRR